MHDCLRGQSVSCDSRLASKYGILMLTVTTSGDADGIYPRSHGVVESVTDGGTFGFLVSF